MVSSSSIRKVGAYFSIIRNSAAGVTLDAKSRRGTMAPVKISNNVFPQRFTGDVIARIGEIEKASIAYEKSTQNARAVLACSGSARYRLNVTSIVSSSAAPSTGSGHGSGSSSWISRP